ncbi:MAG: ParA family protein [Chloroflexota bacterium]|nr:ParA family protein [Chloroflexota bacterium]
METKTRVIIISPNQALVQSLEQFFHQTFDRYGIELVLCRDSLAEAIPVLQQQKGELDVVLLDATLQYLNRRVVETLQAAGGCGLLALAPAGDQTLIDVIQRYGIGEVALPPYEGDDFALQIHGMALTRPGYKAAGAARVRVDPTRQLLTQRLIAITSPAGGVGKSTTAKELAGGLAFLGGYRVALVDYCNTGSLLFKLFFYPHEVLYYTHALHAISLDATSGRESLPEVVGRHLITWRPKDEEVHPTGQLNLVLAPPDPMMWADTNRLSYGFFTQVLDSLLDNHDLVVVDVGQDTTLPAHAAALRKADLSIVVTTPSEPTVDLVCEGLLDLVKAMGIPPDGSRRQIRFVLNKAEKDLPIQSRLVQDKMNAALRKSAPNVHVMPLGEVPLRTVDVETSRIKRAMACLAKPPTPFSRAFEAIARQVAPLSEERPEGQNPLTRLFRQNT